MDMRSLLVLGSTGSVGVQTLDVVQRSGGAFAVSALAAGTRWELLAEQVAATGARHACLADTEAADRLRAVVDPAVHVHEGEEGLLQMIAECDFDIALHGITGAAGIKPTFAVVERGRPLALANKESVVAAGPLLCRQAEEAGVPIVPVDSEHAAIFQCLRGEDRSKVRRMILTASGGPFRDHDPADLESVTPEQALNHPTWDMGPRILVDSATMMNKALEIMEAHYLFGFDPGQIEVVVHRQSIVHGMVEFVDGSVMAQMGVPDMRVAIAGALGHPGRVDTGLRGFDLEAFSNLTFEEPDRDLFPAIDLGFRCIEEGGTSGAVLNAADEVLVGRFLDGQISYPMITRRCSDLLDRRPEVQQLDRASLFHADAWAREEAAL